MPQEKITFGASKAAQKALASNGEFFRYCTFESAAFEGGDFDGTFLSCAFQNCEWYWGLFNLAIFVNCKFANCVFRGSSFDGCRFVDCTFQNCRFIQDNLGSYCTASETKLYGCSTQDCEGWNELFLNHAL